MATAEELHEFLLRGCKGVEERGLYVVQVRCPEERTQTVFLHVSDEGEVVIESPFAQLERVEHFLLKLLSAVGEMTHYGLRYDKELLLLTTVAVLEETTLRGLDHLITEVARRADEIEEIVTDGEDSL